jgi:hypothetical protein
MRRTNIYLPEAQLEVLRRLGDERGVPVAELVRQAVDRWLDSQGVRLLPEDEWSTRIEALLARRRQTAPGRAPTEMAVDRDVTLAIQEARRSRAARRR